MTVTAEAMEMLKTLELVFAGVFGAVAGSFLGACIHRLPRGISLVSRTRSFCPLCQATIAAYDNIPVLSYLLLRGRCRSCGGRISLRYPAVELLTAAGFVLVTYHCRILNGWGWGHAAALAALWAALVLVAFVDLEHRIIPNEVTFPGIILAPIVSGLVPSLQPFAHPWSGLAWLDAVIASLMGLVLGGGHIWLLGLAGRGLFKKEAMGLGDVKLMALVGGILGWPAAVAATLVGSCIGAVIGVAVVLRTRDHYLPFGPFLALGTAIMMLYGAFVVAYFLRPFTGAPVQYAYVMPFIGSAAFNGF